MAAPAQSASSRTVVLLRPKDRKRLESLAAAERVSSGEILRRSLHAYEQEASTSEQATVAALLHEMNIALDDALVSIRSARVEIRENLDKLSSLRQQRA